MRAWVIEVYTARVQPVRPWSASAGASSSSTPPYSVIVPARPYGKLNPAGCSAPSFHSIPRHCNCKLLLLVLARAIHP